MTSWRLRENAWKMSHSFTTHLPLTHIHLNVAMNLRLSHQRHISNILQTEWKWLSVQLVDLLDKMTEQNSVPWGMLGMICKQRETTYMEQNWAVGYACCSWLDPHDRSEQLSRRCVQGYESFIKCTWLGCHVRPWDSRHGTWQIQKFCHTDTEQQWNPRIICNFLWISAIHSWHHGSKKCKIFL